MENGNDQSKTARDSVPEPQRTLWNQNNILVTESKENGVLARNLWVGPRYKMRAGSWLPSQPALINLRIFQHMMGVLLLKPDPKRALMLGVGCATVPRALRKLFGQQVQIDLVDINQEIFKVAHNFFGLEDLSGYTMYVHDGRDFVKRIGERYDLICVDMWGDSDVPDWLLGDEFWGDLLRSMEPDGAVILNASIQSLAPLKRVFEQHFGCYYVNNTQNAMLFGSNRVDLTDAEVVGNADMLRPTLAEVGANADEITESWARMEIRLDG